MSVNGGGWTLFYKNSDESEEGNSYTSFLETPSGFVKEDVDVYDSSVVGVSPVEGLHPISLMVMPVDSPASSISVIHFNNVDVAESVIDPANLVEGCNSYEGAFSFVNGGVETTVNGILFDNGTISFSNCGSEEETPLFMWMGNVYSSNQTRVEFCGGVEGGQCMYFMREEINLNPEGCMCRASGVDNMIWPATPCGEVRRIACFEGEDNGSLERQCGANGQWETFIQGTCSCSAATAFETEWPTTLAGMTAHVACANDISKSRDRLCQPNGEWADVMTGGCTCNAEKYNNIQWEATDGGKKGEHSCDTGALGSGYLRECNMDGTWSLGVEGTCDCPSHYSNGVTWQEAKPLVTQTETCHEDSVGTTMTRQCSVYGSWQPIQGNCDCPEEEIEHNLWPQTTAGLTARIACADGAVGTASTRVCNPTGYWSEIEYGVCSCPADTWTNYAGTSYSFPETSSNSEAHIPCQNGIEGEMTRACDHFGSWSTPSGCYEPVYCPAETVGELNFEATEGGKIVMVMCSGNSNMSYGRLCAENGEWQDVIGYCECNAMVDAMGNAYPVKKSGESFEIECVEGYTGTVSATCSFFGEWEQVQNNCVRKQCPAVTEMNAEWPATDSESSAQIACQGIGEGFQRECSIDGEWSPIEGSCSCPAMYIDGVWYPQSPASTSISSQCPYGYYGSMNRVCNGRGEWTELENNCQRITCPAETYREIEWPATEGGNTAVVTCPLQESSNRRYCREDGQWSSIVEGEGCNCASTTVNENGFYVFAQTEPGVTVTKSCSRLYSGIIRYTCSYAGQWKNLENECERIMCPAESYNGIFFPAAESDKTQHVACADDAVGNGYDRFCDETGVWSSTIEGGCSCKSESIRHTDGHLYNFDVTEGGAVISQVCGGDLSGSVYRSCSVYGNWQSIHGACQRLMCPEEVLDSYVWPATNSSTTVEMSCNAYQVGSVTRYCHPAGVWGDPVNTCQEITCEDMTVNKLADGCMNVRFSPYESMPYVRANVIPSASPDFSVAFRGKTVRICGLEANIAYSLFVQYCNDEDYSQCTDACIVSDIYYQQTCDVMEAVDIADVTVEDGLTTLSFSVKFPTCPYAADSVELVYECIENCPEGAERIVETTPCTSLDGCQAGHRSTINMVGEFSKDATYRVKQRMHLEGQFNELQTYSEVREFRIRDLLRTTDLEPHAEIVNSHLVRLYLGEVDGLVQFKKHVIYIYKKRAGTRRRLVDSLFSTQTLCPLGNGVCEASSTDVIVEPGYDYSFSIYSYPLLSGSKVQVSVAMITVDAEPSFDMELVPGDYFMKVVLSEAKYDVEGTCSFIPQTASSGNQAILPVSLTVGQVASFVTTDLIVNTPYTVTCVVREQYGLEYRLTKESATTPLMPVEMQLAVVSDTIYDVKMSVTVNKPSTAFCAVSNKDITPSITELRLYGEQVAIPVNNQAVEISLLLNEYSGGEYRVSCAAVDIFGSEVLATVVVTSSGEEFSPELIRTVPENGAINVDPFVTMQLQFRYPVKISTCQFCFFILYNTATRTSKNVYSDSYSVNGNTISFTAGQLDSDTTYHLKASTRGLILDAANDIAYIPTSDILISFKTLEYGDISGDVEMDDFFPVNGVIEIEYSSYLILNEGTITLNSLTIDASNVCLQIQHKTATSTTLLIPVYDCVGMLRSSSSYVLVLPKNLLITKEKIPSPRLTKVFETSSASYAPKLIDSFPHLDDVVPTDVTVELYFDQPVSAGNGFLFIAEYDGNTFVNSYNLPASQAVFSDSYPYKMTWDNSHYSLKSSHTYVMSWSEGLVKNWNEQVAAASSVEENVRFNTDVSACSANFLAEGIEGAMDCVYDKNQCVCSQWNMLAIVRGM